MHTIKFDVNNTTSSGGVHASLIIDGQDTGILYLSETEFNMLADTLRAGALESDEVLFECSTENDDVDFDDFDD